MTVQDLVADPSNAGHVGAWDGNEGAFWTAQADRFDETLAGSYNPFLEAAAICEGDRVLDVGCGTGQTTRDCARVASAGSALGVDLSSEMLALARTIATAEGLTNVDFRHADAQIHPFETATFDVVISRMGSMFFGDPVAAFSNFHRALRPDGRLTLLTWQSIAETSGSLSSEPRWLSGATSRHRPRVSRARSRSLTPTGSPPSSTPPASRTSPSTACTSR